MKYVTCAVMRELDRSAIEDFGIPGIVLMENAAIRFFDEVLRSEECVKGKKAVVICGTGNNGGDGFAIARHLYNNGSKTVILFTGSSKNLSLSSDAGINALTSIKMGIPFLDNAAAESNRNLAYIREADFVIDAVFGTGLAREVAGNYALLLNSMTEANKVFSVDIPSGLDGDTGVPLGTAVRADMTITFGAAKKGFRKKTSREYTGDVKVVDISIPAELLN